MTPRPLRQVELYSDAGRLDALYREIESPSAVGVVCHPLPTHGGTLHNKVVFRAARGLESANVATLRFNFRGAGTSEGEFDHGEGEQRDFNVAVRWLLKKHPGLKMIAGGFSFGSWIASRAASELDQVQALFLIGAPVNKYDFSYLSDCRKPILFIHGTNDEFGSVDRLSALVENLTTAETIIVSGAGHFFEKQLDVVEGALREWITDVVLD